MIVSLINLYYYQTNFIYKILLVYYCVAVPKSKYIKSKYIKSKYIKSKYIATYFNMRNISLHPYNLKLSYRLIWLYLFTRKANYHLLKLFMYFRYKSYWKKIIFSYCHNKNIIQFKKNNSFQSLEYSNEKNILRYLFYLYKI